MLGTSPGCLNPNISDEYPLTMEAEAIVGDGGVSLDEAEAEDDAARDAPDRSGRDDDDDGRLRPRRS